MRWAAFDWAALRGSFLWDFKDAVDPKYDYDGPGFSIGAETRPFEPTDFFVRYRRRWRDYDGASPADSNFGREHTVDDVLARLRWHLTRNFGLHLAGTYRHGTSTRDDRNYDAGSITSGVFVTLGRNER